MNTFFKTYGNTLRLFSLAILGTGGLIMLYLHQTGRPIPSFNGLFMGLGAVYGCVINCLIGWDLYKAWRTERPVNGFVALVAGLACVGIGFQSLGQGLLLVH